MKKTSDFQFTRTHAYDPTVPKCKRESNVNLRNEVEVGNKCRLQNYRHVGRVEKLNWIRALLSTGILRSHRQNNTEPLEVDDNKKN
jgi:hypothetical protein